MKLRRKHIEDRRLSNSRAAFSQSAYLMLLTISALFLIGAGALRHAPPTLLYNPSESAPRGWYLLSPDVPTRTGQFALARLPASAAVFAVERRYLPLGVSLLKQVAALRGDYVCAVTGIVHINRRVAGAALREDSRQRPLRAWEGCRLLSNDEFFLMSTSTPASFDSRYFGPVNRTSIQGRAVPVWTWP